MNRAASPLALGTLLDRLAVDHQVSRTDLTGADRRASLVRLRFAFTWVARQAGNPRLAAVGREPDARRLVPVADVPPLSFTTIGRVLGGRRRQTVTSAHRRAVALRDTDPAFRDLTERYLAVMTAAGR